MGDLSRTLFLGTAIGAEYLHSVTINQTTGMQVADVVVIVGRNELASASQQSDLRGEATRGACLACEAVVSNGSS